MKKKAQKVIMVAGGAVIGFINGFFGGGGGMICAPLLEKALKKQTKVAHASAIAVILPISIVSAVAYIVGGSFDLGITLKAGVGVIAGGILGALLLKKLNSAVVNLIFAVLMIAAGVKLSFF